MTDEFASYHGIDKHVASHSVVNHGRKEYIRGIVHSSFAESYFSLLKRGIIGAFHRVSETHIDRYLDEFNFKWNSRTEDDYGRIAQTIEKSGGKRLLHRDSAGIKGIA